MAPKLATSKPAPKSKAEPTSQKEEYCGLINALPSRWVRRAKIYIKVKKMTYKATYDQLLFDIQSDANTIDTQDPNQQGTCPSCQKPFSPSRGRAKMHTEKCEHILCASCVDDFYLLTPSKCQECALVFRHKDWVKWQEIRVGPEGRSIDGWPFCYVPLLPWPKADGEDEGKIEESEEEGLFVTDEEGSGVSDDQDDVDDE